MTAASFVNFLFTMALLLPAAAYAREGVNGWALLALIPVAASFFLATAGLVMLLCGAERLLPGRRVPERHRPDGALLPHADRLHAAVRAGAERRRSQLWIGRNPLTPFTEAFRTAIYYKRGARQRSQIAECARHRHRRLHHRLRRLQPPQGRAWRRSCERRTAITVEGVTKNFRIYRRRETTLKETILRGRRGEWEELRAADDLSFTVPRGQALGDHRAERRGQVDAAQDAGAHPHARPRPRRRSTGASRRCSSSARASTPSTRRSRTSSSRARSTACRARSSSRASTRSSSSPSSGASPTTRSRRTPAACTRASASRSRSASSPTSCSATRCSRSGDESFRQRCYDRMLEFRDAGRTLVLVTHDLGAVHQFCDRAIWLHRGPIRQRRRPARGRARLPARGQRRRRGRLRALERRARRAPRARTRRSTPASRSSCTSLRVTAGDGAERTIFENGETLRIEVELRGAQSRALADLRGRGAPPRRHARRHRLHVRRGLRDRRRARGRRAASSGSSRTCG